LFALPPSTPGASAPPESDTLPLIIYFCASAVAESNRGQKSISHFKTDVKIFIEPFSPAFAL
jgi:hypothetical protein